VRRFVALPLFALLATAGCGGPELIVKSFHDDAEGHVFFKALQDREGNDLSKESREREVGEMPTDWELPERLLGGKGQVRVVFSDGGVRLVEFFAIHKDKDTILRVTRPPKDPKAK
jgi:hypothetical protein